MDELDLAVLHMLPEAGVGGEPAAAAGQWMSTSQVFKRLQETRPGFKEVKKTVQRRLDGLEAQHLISRNAPKEAAGAADAGFDPRAAYWQRKPKALGFARSKTVMTNADAVALQSLQRFGNSLIPAHISREMKGLFELAQATLDRLPPQKKAEASWRQKVEAVSDIFPLIKPQVRPDIFEHVSEALFAERKLELLYDTPWLKIQNIKPNRKVVLPLGMVQSGGYLYLVGGTPGKPNPTLFRLDRMLEARACSESFDYPRTFTLKGFIEEQHQFDFMPQDPVQIKLRFYHNAGDHLRESKVHPAQVIVDEVWDPENPSDNRMTVSAQVVPSLKLTWWLRAFGPDVEILEPQALRESFAAEARAACTRYED